MATKKIITCDIKDCKAELSYSELHSSHKSDGSKNLQVRYSMIWTTDTTEGRSTKPYIMSECLDICDKCKQRILDSGKYIQAWGAQGVNTFEIND